MSLKQPDQKAQDRNYADIIHHPRHVSRVHPPMSIADRAAQFAPFAALTGHARAIEETARQLEEQYLPDGRKSDQIEVIEDE